TLVQFNQQLEPGSLPPSLVSLKLVNYLKKLKPGIIPDTVQTLYFNHEKRKSPLKDLIPPSVTRLYSFYRGAIRVPDSVTELDIFFHKGTKIPDSVTTVKVFAYKTGVSMLTPGFIPPSVTTLVLQNIFKTKPSSIPPTVKLLKFIHYLPEVVDIPDHTTHVEIVHFDEYDSPFARLPPNITRLKLPNRHCLNPSAIPTSLRSLQIQGVYHLVGK
ncbi:hypothetical protein CYY_010125, partial [Polysphondylium violaceum]